MKRILIIVGVLTVLAGATWAVQAWHTVRDNMRAAQFNEDMETLFTALQKYKEYVGSYPSGSNEEIARALEGKNQKNVIVILGHKQPVNTKGEFVDPWGTPLRIYFSGTGVLVRSAG